MRVLVAAIVMLGLAAPRADARGCNETSHIVGREHCTWFGTWSRDVDVARLWLELGVFEHRYTSQPFTLAPGALLAGQPELSTLAVGSTLRVLGGIGPVFYVGGEIDPSSIVDPPKIAGPAPTSNTGFSGLAVAGAHVVLFRFGLSAELAGGGRYDSYDYCPASACMSPTSVSQDRRELEARARLELYIHPRWSLTMMYGHSLIDAGDHSLMIGLGIHMRALDGAY